MSEFGRWLMLLIGSGISGELYLLIVQFVLATTKDNAVRDNVRLANDRVKKLELS